MGVFLRDWSEKILSVLAQFLRAEALRTAIHLSLYSDFTKSALWFCLSWLFFLFPLCFNFHSFPGIAAARYRTSLRRTTFCIQNRIDLFGTYLRTFSASLPESHLIFIRFDSNLKYINSHNPLSSFYFLWLVLWGVLWIRDLVVCVRFDFKLKFCKQKAKGQYLVSAIF